MQVCMIHTSICQKDRLNTGMFIKLDQKQVCLGTRLVQYIWNAVDILWMKEIEQLKCFITWGFGIL